ncbi:MAG: alpha-L-arabinofuranosidase C-terminal domain-containing protein, partial [Gemmatimonadota bacterium]
MSPLEPSDRMSRRTFLGTSAASLAAVAASGSLPGWSGPALGAVIEADLRGDATAVDPMVYGQFLEHFHRQVYGGIFEPGSPLADRHGFRQDVVAALRELGVPVVRWPGGCFASGYHWRNGVGPERTPAYDKAWKVEDPNTFGTDEFVTWCRMIDAEPYICTNAGSGTPEEMSDWVEYCNLESAGQFARLRRANGFADPHDVRYWSIGNENYGDWEVGAKTPEEWGYFVRESAKMMRFVDPSIRLFAPATGDREWTLPLLERAGRYLDYISIHGYWDPLWEENDISGFRACMRRSTGPEARIRETIAMLEELGLTEPQQRPWSSTDRVRIAFDEWNLRGWHHPGLNPPSKGDELIRARDENDRNETYTMADACFSGCFLNACIRHADHVTMANMAPVVNARGPLYVHADGLVKRTTFHVLRMYRHLMASNAVATTVTADPTGPGADDVPAIDAVATRSADGREVALAIVNRHDSAPIDCRLAVTGLPRRPLTATV